MIRAARAADRTSMIEVVRASGLLGPEEVAETEAALDSYLSGETSAEHWLIDDTNDGAIGVAYYAPERMTDGTWNLYLLAVHPNGQGRGRGVSLVRHVEQDLRARRARLLLIETSGTPEFARQRAFYSHLGYRREARIHDFYGRGDDKVIYGKGLTPAHPEPDDRALRVDRQPGGPATGVRVAQTGDLPSLLGLAEAFYREDGFSTASDQLQRNLRILLGSDAARVIVAEQDGRLVGFAITTTSFGLEGGLTAELEDLYVDPPNRRQGLAGQLISDSSTWARDRGSSHLEIVIAPNGKDVSHLHTYYQARGFADEGRRLRSLPLS